MLSPQMLLLFPKVVYPSRDRNLMEEVAHLGHALRLSSQFPFLVCSWLLDS